MANAHATHVGTIAESASLHGLNPVLNLLGQVVVLTEFVGEILFRHTGHVIAVVVPLPGARIGASILLDKGLDDCEYYDLDDVRILSVSPTTSLNTTLGK